MAIGMRRFLGTSSAMHPTLEQVGTQRRVGTGTATRITELECLLTGTGGRPGPEVLLQTRPVQDGGELLQCHDELARLMMVEGREVPPAAG